MERQKIKATKEANRENKAREKKKKVEAKAARAELAESKRRHKELWSLKNVKALGDKLHDAIRANAPITGYRAPYCGVIPEVCKQNQRLALERRRRRKKGEDVSMLPPLREVRPPMLNLNNFGATSSAYMSSLTGQSQYVPHFYSPAAASGGLMSAISFFRAPQ